MLSYFLRRLRQPAPDGQGELPELQQFASRSERFAGVAADEKTGQAGGDDGVGFERAAESQNRRTHIEGRFQIGVIAGYLGALVSGFVDQRLLAPGDVFEAVGHGLKL